MEVYSLSPCFLRTHTATHKKHLQFVAERDELRATIQELQQSLENMQLEMQSHIVQQCDQQDTMVRLHSEKLAAKDAELQKMQKLVERLVCSIDESEAYTNVGWCGDG